MSEARPILTAAERRQRNHDEMSASILIAAREVMREQGVAALNLQEVARRVGMRAPSLYNYFSSKNAIYEALFAQGMRLYREGMQAGMERHGYGWEGIEFLMEYHFTFARENPELYQLLFERPVPGFVPSADGLEEIARLMEQAHHAAEATLAATTLQPPFSADVAMNLVIALSHGITAQHMANEPHLPLGEGRFGSLIPVMLDLLRRAWGQSSDSKSSA